MTSEVSHSPLFVVTICLTYVQCCTQKSNASPLAGRNGAMFAAGGLAAGGLSNVPLTSPVTGYMTSLVPMSCSDVTNNDGRDSST